MWFKMFNLRFSRCCFKTRTALYYKNSDLSLVGAVVVLCSDNPVLKPVCWVGFLWFTDPTNFRAFHCCFSYNFCRWHSWALRCLAIFCAVAFILKYVLPQNCEIMDGNICVCALVGKSGSYVQWNHSRVTWQAAPRINLLKPTGYVTHQQFNIQQLCALPTLYLCVLYLSENKQRLVPLTA